MLEQLQCQSCKNSWSRQVTRGRKPRFCPDCVSTMIDNTDVQQVESVEPEDPTTAEIHPAIPKPPAYKKIWQCPSCKTKLTMHVKLVEPPTCNNPLMHQTKCVEMEPYVRKKEALVFRTTSS